MTDENEWDDDRLLHEMVWSAEGVLRAIKSGNGVWITLGLLESWVNGTRQEWARRDAVSA
jgi:hypothetical protein